MLSLVLLWGCAGNIQALYDAEREAVLGRPGAPGAEWAPDIRVQLSDETLQDLARGAVDAGLLDVRKTLSIDGPLGISASVTPRASVQSLQVRPKKGCDDCLKVTAALQGNAGWAVGPVKGKLPWSAELTAVLRFTADKAGKGFDLTGTLANVTDLEVRAGKAKSIDLGPALKGWARDALKQAPPLRLGRIGGAALPIRRLRLSTAGGQVEVQALSDVPGWAPVRSVPPPKTGWSVAVSEATVGALVRREAFEMGLLDLNLALDPRSIDFEGDTFSMDLRLWRLQGAGWWRDYTVNGTARVANGKLTLRSKTAEERGKSPGAGLADPLALLVEGRILDEVAKGLRQAVPTTQEAALKGATFRAEATGLETVGDAVVLVGTASLQ